MAISKSKRTHKQRVAKYKASLKKNQELLKKRMINNYIKLQQEMMASQEDHTSTHEVNGPEINIDELNILDSDVSFDNLDVDINVDESDLITEDSK